MHTTSTMRTIAEVEARQETTYFYCHSNQVLAKFGYPSLHSFTKKPPSSKSISFKTTQDISVIFSSFIIKADLCHFLYSLHTLEEIKYRGTDIPACMTCGKSLKSIKTMEGSQHLQQIHRTRKYIIICFTL